MKEFLSKKDEERFFLSIFRTLYREFPEGIIEDKENPDFVLTCGMKRIGIELTRIVNKKKERKFSLIEKETAWDKIANDIKLKLIEHKVDPLHIMILHGVTERLEKKVKARISHDLFDFIIRNMPVKNSYFTSKNDFEDNNNFPYEVSYVRILRDESIPSHHVFVSKFGWVQNDFIPELQQLIVEKNKKIKKSIVKTDENWLVIYENGNSGHYFSPSVETQQFEYESAFDKLFFMDILKNSLIELKQKNNMFISS